MYYIVCGFCTVLKSMEFYCVRVIGTCRTKYHVHAVFINGKLDIRTQSLNIKVSNSITLYEMKIQNARTAFTLEHERLVSFSFDTSCEDEINRHNT